MNKNKIFGKRIILSLIVVMLLSLVFVSAINEQKIKLDELTAIKKSVGAERDKTYNAVKDKIGELLSDTKDGKKKTADEIKADNEEAQKLIDALIEVDFLTPEQKKIVEDLKTGITPAPGSPQAGGAEKESPWGKGKWRLWTSIPLVLLLLYILLLRKGRYKNVRNRVGVGWRWFWFRISGKKGKLEAIERYNKQIAELENKIKNVIKKDILGHLNDKEKLIIANFKDANQLLSLGNLIKNSLIKKGSPFVKSHALDLLVNHKSVTIEGIGEVKPIKLKEILDQIKAINDKLPDALNQLISDEILILVLYRNFPQNVRQIILKANDAGARLSDKPVKRLLAAKTAEIDAILNRIDEAVKSLDIIVNTLNRTLGILDKILAEQNEYIKLELGVNDPNDKMYYRGFTKLLAIIDKRFGEFANVAQDILDEADKIKNSFATREKITYDAIDKMVEKLKQESDKIVEINKTVKLDELNKLIDAAVKIASLVQQLNQFKQDKNNKIIPEQLKQFIELVEQLKQDVPQVTLQEFKEQLEGFVIVHKNGEFKIVEVNEDNARIEGINAIITFAQLKEIDNFLDTIIQDRATSLMEEIIERTKADKTYNEVQYKKGYETDNPLYEDPTKIPFKPLKDLLAHYTTEVLGDNNADRELLLRLMVEHKKKQRGNTPKDQDFQIACEIFEGYQYVFIDIKLVKTDISTEKTASITTPLDANAFKTKIVDKIAEVKAANQDIKLKDFTDELVELQIIYEGMKYVIFRVEDDSVFLKPI